MSETLSPSKNEIGYNENEYPESEKFRKEPYRCDLCQDLPVPCKKCTRGQIFIEENNIPRYPKKTRKN